MKKKSFVRNFIFCYIGVVWLQGSLTLYLANDKYSQFCILAGIVSGLVGIITGGVAGTGIADHVKQKKEQG